jgi:hypothetical protein
MLLALLVPLVFVLLFIGLVLAGLFVLLALFISFVTAHGTQQQGYNLTTTLLQLTDLQYILWSTVQEKRLGSLPFANYTHSEMK